MQYRIFQHTSTQETILFKVLRLFIIDADDKTWVKVNPLIFSNINFDDTTNSLGGSETILKCFSGELPNFHLHCSQQGLKSAGGEVIVVANYDEQRTSVYCRSDYIWQVYEYL